MEKFLSDYVEGEAALPWTIGDDAIVGATWVSYPSQLEEDAAGAPIQGSAVVQIMAAAGVPARCNILVSADYGTATEQEDSRRRWETAFVKLLPGYNVTASLSRGPFEDPEGQVAQFDGRKAGLSERKL